MEPVTPPQYPFPLQHHRVGCEAPIENWGETQCNTWGTPAQLDCLLFPIYDQYSGFTDAYAGKYTEPDFHNTNLSDTALYQCNDPEQFESSHSGPYFYHTPEQTFGVTQSSASIPNNSELFLPIDFQLANAIDPNLASPIDPQLESLIDPRLTSPIDPQVDPQIGVCASQVNNTMQSNLHPPQMPSSRPAVDAGCYSSDDSGNSFSTPESPEQESAGDDRSPSVPSGEEEDDCEMPDVNSDSESQDDGSDRSSRDGSTGTTDKASRTSESGLRFSSYEEALKACPGPGWTPKRPDNTLPQTDEDRAEIVARLLRAFRNREGVHDKTGKVYESRWNLRDPSGNLIEYYDPLVMEKVCWDTVRVAEDMHMYQGAAHLPLHDREFNKSIYKTKDWTFGMRIDWMERLMRDFKGRCDKLIKGTELIMYVASPEEIYTTSEANRVQNDKRQAYLEKGRKVVRKQAEKEDTGARAIPKQGKNQPKRTQTSRTGSSADISQNTSSGSGSELNQAEEVETGQQLKKSRARPKKSPNSASRPTGVRKNKRKAT